MLLFMSSYAHPSLQQLLRKVNQHILLFSQAHTPVCVYVCIFVWNGYTCVSSRVWIIAV